MVDLLEVFPPRWREDRMLLGDRVRWGGAEVLGDDEGMLLVLGDRDLVLALDVVHWQRLRALAPDRSAAAKVRLLREFDPAVEDLEHGDLGIYDPWYGGPEDFESTWGMIDAAVPGVVRAVARELDVAKVSYAALPELLDDYALLPCGGALGRGVGPLVVARDPQAELAGATVAVPGERTTAYLLLRLWRQGYDVEVMPFVDEVIRIPFAPPLFEPLLAVVPLHIFAMELATAKGLDVDQPRNLAKSVTVE